MRDRNVSPRRAATRTIDRAPTPSAPDLLRRSPAALGLGVLVSFLSSCASSSLDETSPRPAVDPRPEEATGAEGGDAAAEMARKLNNPLSNIRALMIDNAVGFDTGNTDDTSYAFQVQPVYAIDFPERGFTLLPRAVIPIVGLEPGTKIPPISEPVPGNDPVWGLGDSILQLFYAPHVESDWKWGIGPQFSFATATDPALKGPDWGAGLAGVVTGGLTSELSFSGIVGNMWSFDGDFSTGLLHPILVYTVASLPGAYLAYNAPSTANWKATGGNVWTVPLGLTLGRTFDMGGGHGFDCSIGPYYNVARPDGAADWVVRFSANWLFP